MKKTKCVIHRDLCTSTQNNAGMNRNNTSEMATMIIVTIGKVIPLWYIEQKECGICIATCSNTKSQGRKTSWNYGGCVL